MLLAEKRRVRYTFFFDIDVHYIDI